MPERGLAALYKALKYPTGPHLHDEMLALIVDAELAGENIDQLYSQQVTHIERCERCAINYSELVMMMRDILAEMAQTAETPDKITRIWNQALAVTADYIQDKFRLTFSTTLPQIGEPKPDYKIGDERLLTRQQIPGSPPLTLEARLWRQTPLTCRLTIQLQRTTVVQLEGYQIQIKYGEIEKTAATNPDGTATFESIPIANLVGLEIEVEGSSNS